MSISAEPVTFEDLVALEPALGELEVEVVEAGLGGCFDGDDAWFGRPGIPGFKARMKLLVGWSRRAPEWWTPPPGPPTPVRLDDLVRQVETRQPALVAILAEDIANGREVLWSSMAYDVAYRHLYGALAAWDYDWWSSAS